MGCLTSENRAYMAVFAFVGACLYEADADSNCVYAWSAYHPSNAYPLPPVAVKVPPHPGEVDFLAKAL